MARYFAYQIYSPDSAQLQVDTDPSKLFAQLAKDLAHVHARTNGVEAIEIGQVSGDDVEDALNQIRGENWIEGTHGYADGCLAWSREV